MSFIDIDMDKFYANVEICHSCATFINTDQSFGCILNFGYVANGIF